MTYHLNGLGAAFPAGTRSEPLRALQRELARLGFLASGGGSDGADGLWGPRTAGALRSAARQVGWRGAPYSPMTADSMRSGTVSVPDDFVRAISTATPQAGAAPPPVPTMEMFERGSSMGPLPTPGILDKSAAPSHPTAPPEPVMPAPAMNWTPVIVAGGAVLVALGGIAAWTRSVRPNRRRNRRR